MLNGPMKLVFIGQWLWAGAVVTGSIRLSKTVGGNLITGNTGSLRRWCTRKQTIPHFAYVDECDVSDLVKLRGMLREPFSRKDATPTGLYIILRVLRVRSLWILRGQG